MRSSGGCRGPNSATRKGLSRNPRARQTPLAPSCLPLQHSCSEASSSVSRRPLGCHPSNPPRTYICFIMLRTTLRQCSRQLQSCSAKARLSTIAASPARTNAITTCRRPLAVAQRRQYAIAAEDTNKGVVRGHMPQSAKFSSAWLTMTA